MDKNIRAIQTFIEINLTKHNEMFNIKSFRRYIGTWASVRLRYEEGEEHELYHDPLPDSYLLHCV